MDMDELWSQNCGGGLTAVGGVLWSVQSQPCRPTLWVDVEASTGWLCPVLCESATTASLNTAHALHRLKCRSSLSRFRDALLTVALPHTRPQCAHRPAVPEAASCPAQWQYAPTRSLGPYIRRVTTRVQYLLP